MNANLKSILEKIARERATASLSDADFATIAAAVAGPQAPAPDAPAPLWRFIRRNVLLFKGIFEWNFDAEVDVMLIEAGASPELLKGYQATPRLAAVVSREALKRSVRRHLTHEQPAPRAHAARLVGLLGLDDTASILAESLENGREERRDWSQPVIAASLEALAMLGHPQTRAFAMKYVTNDDWTLRRSAQAAALVAEGRPTEDELNRILDTQFDWSLVALLPEVFIDAAKKGTLGEASLDRLLESLTRYITAWETVADIVVGAEWKEGFKRLMTSDDENMRAALAVRAAWSQASWTVPALRARLEEEENPEVKMCLVTALATVAGRDEALLDARFESDDAGDKLGAIWATVGTGRHGAELAKLVDDTHPQVRRAAQAALASLTFPPDREHLELAWTDLLHNEDSWWPWKLPLSALVANNVTLPVSADVFRFISADNGRLDGRALDRALALFEAHPLQLLRWLRADAPSSQRIRALAFAGLLERGFDDAVEHVLLEAQSSEVAQQAALEVIGGRGPTSQAAEVKSRIALFEQPRGVDGALVATAVYAAYGDSQLRKRATGALATFGDEAEPYLAMLLASADSEVAHRAADVVVQLSAPRDPLLADVARLLSGESCKLGDLATLPRLVASLSPRVRVAVGELGAMPGISRDQVMQLFSWLVVDRDADVAAAALGALAAAAGDAKWVKELVLAQISSPNWRAREKAVTAMGQIGDPMFVPRLLKLTQDEDSSLKDQAVRGLERVAEKHPQLGLVVLDIREPQRVATRFGLNEQINWQADKHTEGLRMLLLGLDKRKDAKEAKANLGRKVMISQLDDESAAHGATLSAEQVDALAIFLRVVYSDEETGSIIAEVSEDPTAEVLSAMLQSTDVAVRRVVWS